MTDRDRQPPSAPVVPDDAVEPVVLVLGPVAVRSVAGERIVPGHAGRLLAELVASEGRSAHRERLIQAVWGDRAPPTASSALRTHLTTLRRCLDGTGAGIDRVGGAVVLRGGPVDSDLFERAVGHTARALAAGELAEAERAVMAASAWWRGDPFEPFAGSSGLTPVVVRLLEQRARVAELRAELLLRSGRTAEAVTELEALVAAEPLRERHWELLMHALYLAGRQAEALAAFDRLRATLVGDLGIDPGPAVRGMHHRVLAQDPTLLVPGAPSPPAAAIGVHARRGPSPAGAGPPVPAGRHALIDVLRSALGSSSLVTVTGPPGIGKTTLVDSTAALVLGRRELAVVDLEPVADASLLVLAVADALGLARDADAGHDLTDLVCRRLAGRPCRLVLDGGDHLGEAVAAFVAALRRELEDLQVLVGRRAALGAEDEVVVTVPPLPAPAAVAVLAEALAELGVPVAPGDRPVLEGLASDLDGHPLGLLLAAGWASLLGLGVTAERLRRGHLPSEPDLVARVSASLDVATDGARRSFVRLGVFRGPFDLDAVMAVAGLGARDAARAVRELQRLSLIHAGEGPGRLRLLAPIRDAALSLAEEQGVLDEARAAWRGFLVERLAPWGVERVGFDSLGVRAALDAWRADLRALVEDALGGGDPDLVTAVLLGHIWYWDVSGARQEAASTLRRGVEVVAARAPGHPGLPRLRALWAQVGQTFAWMAAHLEDSERAIAEARAVGDVAAEVLATIGAGLGAGWSGDLARGHSLLVGARDLVGTAPPGAIPPFLAVMADEYLAIADIALGDPGRAVQRLEVAQYRYASIGSPWGEVHALTFIGMAASIAGDRVRAERALAEVVDRASACGDEHSVLHARLGLADLQGVDEPVRVAGGYEDLAARFLDLGDLGCAAQALCGGGGALLALGEPGRAVGTLLVAARLAGAVDDAGVYVRAGLGVATALRDTGRPVDACRLVGALEARSCAGGRPVRPEDLARAADLTADLRAALGDDVVEVALADGRAAGDTAVLAHARSALAPGALTEPLAPWLDVD